MSVITHVKLNDWWKRQLPLYEKSLSSKDLSVIADIYSVFGHSQGTRSESRHKKHAATMLCDSLDGMESGQIMGVLDRFGYSTRMEWFVDWRKQEPREFLTPDMTSTERFWVLALATAHPCGHLREKAFRAMIHEVDGRALCIALSGLYDWVPQVRAAAEELLKYKLQIAAPAELCEAIPYALPVLRSEHARGLVRDPASGFSAYITALTAQEMRPALAKTLAEGDIHTRRFCVRVLSESDKGAELLLSRLPHEPDPNLRREIFSRLTEQGLAPADTAAIPEAAAVMLRDEFPKNRYEGLLWLCLHRPDQALSYTIKFLTDAHAAVRTVAQEWSERLDADFLAVAYYREKLTTCASGDPSLPALLYGLSEVGDTSDLAHITSYLPHDRAAVVSAAMTALVRLTPAEDMESVAATLTEALTDSRAGVVKTASLLLFKMGCPDGVRVTEIMTETDSELTRVRCLTVLSRAGKWRRLIGILTALRLGGDHLTRKANAMLERWLLTCNYSFAKPTAAEASEVGRLTEICSENGQITPEQAKQLTFCLATK